MKQIFTMMEQTNRHRIKAVLIFYGMVAIGMIVLGFTQPVYSYIFLLFALICVLVLCILLAWQDVKYMKKETYQRIMLLPEKKAYLWSVLLFYMITFVGLFLVFYFSWLLFLIIPGKYQVNQIVLISWDHALLKSFFPIQRLNLFANLMFWMNIGVQWFVISTWYRYRKFIFACPLIIFDIYQLNFYWKYPEYSVIFHMLFYVVAWVYAYLIMKHMFGHKKEVRS